MSKVIYETDARGKWRATLKANNGVVIFASSQGYASKQGCQKNLLTLRRIFAELTI